MKFGFLIFIEIRKKLYFEVWDLTRKAVERYENFCRIREQLELIADFAMKLPSLMKRLDKVTQTAVVKRIKKQIKDNLFPEYLGKISLPFFGFVRLEVDPQGIMDSQSRELDETNLFDIKKIDILRIRKCQICRRIFWAERFESFYCNADCGNKLRKLAKVKPPPTQEEKDAAARRKRAYNLQRKVQKLTKKYKDRVIKIQKSAIFNSTKSDDSFKLEKGTNITITHFVSLENEKHYPIQCNVRSETGKEGFFTLPNDKKTPYRIKLKLGTN
jgi:hypothetical protein